MPLVFVDLKSLRHLFTQNVCPTMKSHTLQEVQDSENQDSLMIFHSEEPIFLWLPLRKVLACCCKSCPVPSMLVLVR